MESEIILILFGGFLGLLFIGAPITVALGVSTMISFLYLGENPIKFVQIAFTSVGSFPLMALPAFILAGALMEASGLSRRLINVAESFAGPFTGGMSAATVFACLFFGAISGSGPATTAAVGMLMIPAMIDRKYDRDFASAITASSGGLGIVIPPSIPLIIFGIAALGMPAPPEAVAEHGTFQTVSIPKLFIAGFMPAFLIAGSLLVMNYILAKKNGFKGSTEGWSARHIWCEMYRGFWALMAPVVILGGIYSGFFTPTEAAIVAIFYTLVVGAFIYRELSWEKLFVSLETTTWLTGRVLLIMFTATVFGRLLVENQIPAIIADGMLSVTDNIYIIWTLVIFFLLFVGMFMETLATILILVPVMLPVAYSVGIDPIHFGVVMVCCLGIGFQTPPLGENLFIASGISNISIERISIAALPFAAINTIAIFIIAFVPEISLWLPRFFGY
ncbi:Sialic acid TRAP transporter permease protein SiaT [Roseovarius albus]|uniref:TRAP transporter large permease protein n=1 Tax=Roseovarius albus TaxID=1247867 RepID=A0A1X6ZX44_9RHOB|nr:TRAP transporter large permease [Roseovarius albus]SLN64290.1 Sialic acid TRAP transporter permease protein SiaT [Roseovarius albus]